MRRSTLRSGPPSEIKAFEASKQEFSRHKAAATQTTAYGLAYSPHYLRRSREEAENT